MPQRRAAVSHSTRHDRFIGVGLPPFQALLDAYREDVYRFLVAAVGAQEADDCFQETFLSALRAYPRLRDASNLRAWVFTIAHHKALDEYRSRGLRPKPSAVLPDRPTQAPRDDGAVWEQVRALPPKQRAAILHRFGGDLAYKDVAQVMQCSEEAARSSVSEGLRKLREVRRR